MLLYASVGPVVVQNVKLVGLDSLDEKRSSVMIKTNRKSTTSLDCCLCAVLGVCNG